MHGIDKQTRRLMKKIYITSMSPLKFTYSYVSILASLTFVIIFGASKDYINSFALLCSTWYGLKLVYDGISVEYIYTPQEIRDNIDAYKGGKVRRIKI